MSDESAQFEQRKANLASIVQLGARAYPNRFATTHSISQLVDEYGDRGKDELDATRIETACAGRNLSIRSFGKASFFVLSDGSWIPHFRVKVGESPPNWDLSTVFGAGTFWAYEERETVLGFYQERLVYRESLGKDHIQALGKLWQREALFKSRLESPPSSLP